MIGEIRGCNSTLGEPVSHLGVETHRFEPRPALIEFNRIIYFVLYTITLSYSSIYISPQTPGPMNTGEGKNKELINNHCH